MVGQVATQYGISLDDYLQRYTDEGRFEIIDGEVVFMSPNASGHSTLVRSLFRVLDHFLADSPEWEVFQETAYVRMGTDRSNWVKGALEPDLMLVRKTDLAAFKTSAPNWAENPLMLVPPLVIEVISQTDRYTIVSRKINQYLENGVQAIWMVDPFDRLVKIYRAGADRDKPDVLKGDQVLTADDLLPGFRLPLTTLFAG